MCYPLEYEVTPYPNNRIKILPEKRYISGVWRKKYLTEMQASIHRRAKINK